MKSRRLRIVPSRPPSRGLGKGEIRQLFPFVPVEQGAIVGEIPAISYSAEANRSHSEGTIEGAIPPTSHLALNTVVVGDRCPLTTTPQWWHYFVYLASICVYRKLLTC
jgi:hypothetical protein